MFGFPSWQIAAYLTLIAVTLVVIALAVGVIALALNDAVDAVAGFFARRRAARQVLATQNNHTASPE